MINPDFWRGKRVLITGHTGFKGGWLSLWLQHLGANIVGLSLDPVKGKSFYYSANVSSGITSLRGDIRDINSIMPIFKKYKPEIVFHLAAQSIVRYSYHNPVETYETNVMGTLNILEGIRSIDTVKAAIMVTTDKCYHNDGRRQGYREDDPLGGHDPYSSSKAAAEILISSYRDSYFTSYDSEINTALASVRAGNVIGGGDWAEDRLIPDIVRSFQDGKMVVIRNPYSVRPWQHVLDPLYGYMYLAESLVNDPKKYSSGWNFGPVSNDSKTVQWIVEEMAKKWGDKTNWVVDDSVQPHEADYLTLDCERANKILNWMPKWNINDALHKIIEWHKLEHSGGNCRKICIEQINEYMES